MNSPVKSFGPVCNAMCSALASFYIAGHYSRPNEQLIDTWTRLALLPHGAPTQGAFIPMADAIFAADRGYNCKQSIEFVSNKLGSSCFGTHKRSLDFPFVFGEGPIRKRHKGMVVSEKGFRAIWSAKQKIPSGSSRRQVQASVYRESFSGRIGAVYSNNERMLSSTKFTLDSREAFRGNVDTTRIEELGIVYDLSAAAENSAHSSQITSLERLKLEKWYESGTHLTYFKSQGPAWFLSRALVSSS